MSTLTPQQDKLLRDLLEQHITTGERPFENTFFRSHPTDIDEIRNLLATERIFCHKDRLAVGVLGLALLPEDVTRELVDWINRLHDVLRQMYEKEAQSRITIRSTELRRDVDLDDVRFRVALFYAYRPFQIIDGGSEDQTTAELQDNIGIDIKVIEKKRVDERLADIRRHAKYVEGDVQTFFDSMQHKVADGPIADSTPVSSPVLAPPTASEMVPPLWIGMVEEQRGLLDTGLASLLALARGHTVKGRQLREATKSLPETEQHALLDLCVPVLLSRNLPPPNDIYSFTLPGLLGTSRAQTVATIVNASLSLLRKKYEEPGGPSQLEAYSWAEVQVAAGITDDDFALAELVLVTARLSTDFRGDRDKRPITGNFWVSEVDIEQTVKCDSVVEYVDYLGGVRDPVPPLSSIAKERRDKLTDHQRVIVDEIYSELRASGAWPATHRLNATLHGRGIDYLAIESRSRQFFVGSGTSKAGGAQPTTLTLLGLFVAEQATADAGLVFQTLSYLASRYLDTRGDETTVPGLRVAAWLGLVGHQGRAAFLRLARLLAAQGSPFIVNNSGNDYVPEKVEFGTDAQFLKFTKATSLDGILRSIYPEQAELLASETSKPSVARQSAGDRREAGSLEDWRAIKSKIKPGGQASVRVVRHVRTSEKGVLKRLLPDASAKAIKRFRREIKIVKRLKHPHIADILGASSEKESPPWYVSRHARLGSLHDNLAHYKGDLGRSLRVVRDIALALGAAHERKIIHRDIKPQNLLVFSLDNVALTDFGIAYDPDDPAITTMESKVGPDWFGPSEMFDREHEPTDAFDVFSLGRVLYVMLSGGYRFGRSGHRGETDDLSRRLDRPEFAEINVLLDHMMAENHGERLPRMNDVIRGIDRVLDSVAGRRRRPSNGCQMCDEGLYVDAGLLSWEPHAPLRIAPDNQVVDLATFKPRLLVCSKCGDACLRLGHLGGLSARPPWVRPAS